MYKHDYIKIKLVRIYKYLKHLITTRLNAASRYMIKLYSKYTKDEKHLTPKLHLVAIRFRDLQSSFITAGIEKA